MDDFLSQIDSVLKSENPQQQNQIQPAKQEPVENDFIGNIDKILKSQPTQDDRMAAAEQWAAQRRGSEKVLGGVGVRDILENSLPFVSAGIKFKKNKDYMEAKKAFDEGRATDEQLGKIAEFNYDQQRAASKTGIGSKILGAAVATPAMLGEAYMASPVTGAVGSALGLGRVAGAGAGQFAMNAAKAGAQQSLAAPMMPSMWLNESQQRQMKNGGEWYSPENIAAPLLHSAISNALLGQISSMTGGLPTVPRIAIAGLAMPVEQQAADALVSVGDEALKKAGVDEKFLTETKFGTLGQLARGEKGEAMGNLTTQIIIGAAFGAFHGDKPPVVEKFAKAVDALEAKGMNPTEAAAEIKKAAVDPKAEPKVDEVKAFADSLDDIPQVREFLKSNNEQKPQESPKQPLPATQQPGPEIPPPGDQIGSPGFNPARQPAKLGKTAPKAEQQAPVSGEAASSDANQRTVTVTPLKSPFEGLPKADLDSLAVALGVKSKDLFKMPLHSQQALVDAMFGGQTAEPAKSTQEVIYPNARVSEPAVAQPEPAKIELGQSSETTPRANGQKITRIPISENGKEIAEFKGFQSGKTLHIDWLGATGAGAKDQWAKGSLGTTKMRDIFRQLADRYPDAEFLKYMPADGRLNAGKSRMIDLNEFRQKKLVTDKEMQSAINDAVQSGQSPAAIAEAISAGHAQAEKDEGGNGPAGKAKGFGQTKPVDRSGEQAEPQPAAKSGEPDKGLPQGDGGVSEPPAKVPEDSPLWKMADRMEQHARETLKDYTKGDTLMSNIDPKLIGALVEFTAAKIIKGGVTANVYTQAMIQKFGDVIKPHLDEIWSKAQALAHGNKPAEATQSAEEPVNAETKTAEPTSPTPPAAEPPTAEAKAAEPQDATAIKNATVAKERESRGIPAAMEADPVGHTFPEIADQVGRIAKTEPGKIDDLIQSLQKKPRAVNDLEDAMLLRRQVDLQNNYDRFNDQYQKAKETNDAEGQTIAGNELAAARAKLRELYDVNKSVGTETGRGLNARKMLMAKDYTLAKMTTDYELSIGRKMNPNDIEAVSKAFERIKQLESKIAELEKKQTEAPLEPKPTVEPKQPAFGRRTEAAKAEVDAAWDLLKKATKGKMFANPAFDPEVIGAAAGVAKAYIKLGVAKFSDFVEAVQSKSGHTASEDEKKVLQMAWDRAQADLKKVELPPMTKEQKQTTAEYREAVKDWNKKLHENEKANDHAVVKGIRHVGNAADFLRAVMLGGDVPPMLRQGGFVTAGRPILSSKALGRSAKGFLSEAKAHEVLIDLTERENAKNGLYKRAMDLDVGDIHGQDEFLHSSWIKQVPGFSHLERWHSSYLTQLRADLFDAMTSSMSRSGRPDEAEAKIIGNAVNVFTGKGNLYSAERAVGLLNKVFLAPKWVASRFQLAIGQPLWHGIYEHGLQPRARAAVAKEYARAFAGLGAMYSLAGLAIASGLMNATIEKDPRSSDFGEIKIGNTRINPLFGTSQAIRTMAQLISGQRKSTVNGKITEQPASETVGKELRNKLAPIPSAAITGTELTRRDLGFSRKGPSVPHPQDWKSMATDYLTPLSLQDMYKACEDLGIPKGLTVGLLASFGAGVKVYGK